MFLKTRKICENQRFSELCRALNITSVYISPPHYTRHKIQTTIKLEISTIPRTSIPAHTCTSTLNSRSAKNSQKKIINTPNPSIPFSMTRKKQKNKQKTMTWEQKKPLLEHLVLDAPYRSMHPSRSSLARLSLPRLNASG